MSLPAIHPPMLAFFLVLPALPLLQAGAGTRQPAAAALRHPVLTQNGRRHAVQEVLDAVAAYNPEAVRMLEDPQLRRLHLRSLRFLREVEAFGDRLLLEEAGIQSVPREALLAEAGAWARDRGTSLFPEAALASYGLEIEVRARLIAQQPAEFSQPELRRHFIASVPEFFGEMAASWIRVPLDEPATGAVLPAAERKARYDLLEEAADRITSGETPWAEAVERYSQDPQTLGREGYLGLIRRDMVPRFEEPFLRAAFRDLGYKRLEGPVLRGPITGDRWIYLLRIESVETRGVVDMQRVLPRVERSLREQLLQERLAALRAAAGRAVHLPDFPPQGG